jgi:hypothetical protein
METFEGSRHRSNTTKLFLSPKPGAKPIEHASSGPITLRVFRDLIESRADMLSDEETEEFNILMAELGILMDAGLDHFEKAAQVMDMIGIKLERAV